MANTATCATLLTRAAALADMAAFSTTTFVTTSQAEQWVNDALQKIHYKLANSGEDYFRSTADTAMVSGTSTYNLPSDFYKMTGVDYVTGGKSYRMGRFMSQERTLRQDEGPDTSTIPWSNYDYRVSGTVIEVIPTPGTGTIRVWYIPQFAKISGATVVSSAVPEGWEEFAALECAIKALAKEESSNPDLVQQRNELWQLITDFCEPRDRDEPKRLVDVYGRFSRVQRAWGM